MPTSSRNFAKKQFIDEITEIAVFVKSTNLQNCSTHPSLYTPPFTLHTIYSSLILFFWCGNSQLLLLLLFLAENKLSNLGNIANGDNLDFHIRKQLTVIIGRNNYRICTCCGCRFYFCLNSANRQNLSSY